MRPQWFVRPPSMRDRNQRNDEPGAVVYGSPSISQNPFGAMNSLPIPALPSTNPHAAMGQLVGPHCSLKSLSGSSRGPASSITTFSPPSVSTLRRFRLRHPSQ